MKVTKVTAIIPDELIREAMKHAKAKNITETLKIALKEYIALKRIKSLSASVLEEPLEFKYGANELRNKNNG